MEPGLDCPPPLFLVAFLDELRVIFLKLWIGVDPPQVVKISKPFSSPFPKGSLKNHLTKKK